MLILHATPATRLSSRIVALPDALLFLVDAIVA